MRYDDRLAYYTRQDALDLELAYAITVHKSQGSEFDAVIVPVFRCIKPLCYRNLLYTAVTRAKSLLILVGSRETLAEMVENDRRTLRYSGLRGFWNSRQSGRKPHYPERERRAAHGYGSAAADILVFPERCAYCRTSRSGWRRAVFLPVRENFADYCAAGLPALRPGQKPRVPVVEQKDRWTGQRRRFITKGRSAAVFCSLKRLPAVCGGGICPHDSAGGAPGSTANPGSTELRRCPRPCRDERRGFNPTQAIAEELAKRLDLPVLPLLVKVQEPPVPQKQLSASQRRGNVLGVFDVEGHRDLSGMRLLVVDDVITTGATIAECAKMLKLCGAQRVVGTAVAATRLSN